MNPYYKIKNCIRSSCYNLRGRIQRFKRGYAYGDVWDMDYWFMHTIKPMLIHLRDHGIGAPIELYNPDEDNERIYWESTLTEMINCLDMMDEEKVLEHLGFKDYDDYKRMTKKDREKCHNIMEENKNRFFELFSKYFYNLWD